jgi:hypothetical protein
MLMRLNSSRSWRRIAAPLAWSDKKTAALREKGATGHPIVEVDPLRTNAIGLSDGGHRIAEAARNGQNIKVAVNSPEAAAHLEQTIGAKSEHFVPGPIGKVHDVAEASATSYHLNIWLISKQTRSEQELGHSSLRNDP